MQELLSDIQVKILDGNNWLLIFKIGQYRISRLFKPQDSLISVIMGLQTLSLEMEKHAKTCSAQQRNGAELGIQAAPPKTKKKGKTRFDTEYEVDIPRKTPPLS